MNPEALTWATDNTYARRVTFRMVAIREGEQLKLSPNDTVKKVSYEAEGSWFYIIVMREIQ